MALRQLRCSVRSSTAAAVKGARPYSLRSAQLVRPAALHAATPALSARAAAAQAFSTLAARRTPSVPALATDMARLSRFAAAHGLRIASVRTFSAEAAGKGAAGSAGSEAEAARAAAEAEAEAARAQAEAEAEAAYFEAEEPFVAKLSRWVWTTIKMSFGIGLIVGILYAGYTIVVTLLPSGASANAIMRRASDVVKHDPELSTYFGDIKTYGEDFGSSREGRRYYVPDYTYTDEMTDETYHRVRFNLEGERGRKATVWAEVRDGTYDFRYIIVMTKERSRVWSLVDNRPPERSMEERQANVTTLLQNAGWTFYADNEAELAEQGAVVGDYWLKVRTVRCDLDAARCAADGVASRPAWTTGPYAAGSFLDSTKELFTGGSGTKPRFNVVKGMKTLQQLEVMTKQLRREQSKIVEGEGGVMGKIRRTLGV